MNEKPDITVLYDAAEDVEKAKAEEEGKPFPLAYAQVADALEKRGHNVKTIGITKKIHSLVALVEKDTSDVIFNLCEAIACSPQHEHNVVGLLELFEKCFTGCGSAGWMLAVPAPKPSGTATRKATKPRSSSQRIFRRRWFMESKMQPSLHTRR
jgi:hypothetical protein